MNLASRALAGTLGLVGVAALFELIQDMRADMERLDQSSPEQFLIAYGAAALLVDAARFLRENFHRIDVVRRKLDEPDPVYGIPARMYDAIQHSLTDPYHAWQLWQANRFFDKNHAVFEAAAVENRRDSGDRAGARQRSHRCGRPRAGRAATPPHIPRDRLQ